MGAGNQLDKAWEKQLQLQADYTVKSLKREMRLLAQ